MHEIVALIQEILEGVERMLIKDQLRLRTQPRAHSKQDSRWSLLTKSSVETLAEDVFIDTCTCMVIQVFRIFKLARVLKLARHSPGLQAIAYTLQVYFNQSNVDNLALSKLCKHRGTLKIKRISPAQLQRTSSLDLPHSCQWYHLCKPRLLHRDWRSMFCSSW